MPHGKGTFGSRSISVGGAALLRAAEKIIDKARHIAAHLLETAEADIRFDDGQFTIEGTDRSIALIDVAKAAYAPARLPAGMEIGLAESAIVLPPGPTFPNGCHVCEVEIDRDTGVVEIVNYTVVDDVGRMLNPLLVKGQIHGGIAQGAGQALMEEVVYDGDSGQLVTLIQMEARIVINEKQGIILVTGNVEISPVGIAHRGLSITSITPEPVASPQQPVLTERRYVGLDTTRQQTRSSTRLLDLLSALDQLKVPVEDQIAIIYEMKKTGALHAEIVDR